MDDQIDANVLIRILQQKLADQILQNAVLEASLQKLTSDGEPLSDQAHQ